MRGHCSGDHGLEPMAGPEWYWWQRSPADRNPPTPDGRPAHALDRQGQPACLAAPWQTSDPVQPGFRVSLQARFAHVAPGASLHRGESLDFTTTLPFANPLG